MNEDVLIINNKFNVVEREIERLKVKIHITKVLGFLNYMSTRLKNLSESKPYNRIYSICEKIGSDIEYWSKSGSVSQEGLDAYHKGREETLRKLRSLNKDIEHRIPTLLEGILAILNGFVVIIATVLPTVAKLIKTVALLTGIDAPK